MKVNNNADNNIFIALTNTILEFSKDSLITKA